MRSKHVCSPWVVVGALGGALMAAAPARADDVAAWSQRRAVTVTGTGGLPLLDFPVRVGLTAASFDFGSARSDGGDLRAVAADLTTPLPYWIESWDPVGQTAVVWVRLPAIAPCGPTRFHLLAGNPAATSQASITARYELARATNALRGRFENFWAAEQTSVVRLVEVDDLIEKVDTSPGALLSTKTLGRGWVGWVGSTKTLGRGWVLSTKTLGRGWVRPSGSRVSSSSAPGPSPERSGRYNGSCPRDTTASSRRRNCRRRRGISRACTFRGTGRCRR